MSGRHMSRIQSDFRAGGDLESLRIRKCGIHPMRFYWCSAAQKLVWREFAVSRAMSLTENRLVFGL